MNYAGRYTGVIMNSLNYRQYLQEELLLRQKRNPRYSARAMARDLSISAPFFSQILSGQRELSEDRAHAIASKLPWSRRKREAFTQLTRLENVQDPRLREQILRSVNELMAMARGKTHSSLRKLRIDEFKIVSDWYHMAIYELTETKGFKNEPEWIANRLGISPRQAETAVARLLQVHLLECDQAGCLRKTKSGCKMGAVPSQAIRNLHDQQLTLAKSALVVQNPSDRDFSGTTMCIDPKKLPRAKAMIRKFHDELMKFLESGERTTVFHFASQLYQLDKNGKE